MRQSSFELFNWIKCNLSQSRYLGEMSASYHLGLKYEPYCPRNSPFRLLKISINSFCDVLDMKELWFCTVFGIIIDKVKKNIYFLTGGDGLVRWRQDHHCHNIRFWLVDAVPDHMKLSNHNRHKRPYKRSVSSLDPAFLETSSSWRKDTALLHFYAR